MIEEKDYSVHDIDTLGSMVVSAMRIKSRMRDGLPQRVASYRHKHADHDEVYHFINGTGEMQLDDATPFSVNPGDTVLVPEGVTHEVWNTGNKELYFLMIYQK